MNKELSAKIVRDSWSVQLSGAEDVKAHLGKEIGLSNWLLIDQERIDSFAKVTEDQQWIHVNEDKARQESPFGKTIAHGYLTLSLLTKFAKECICITGLKLAVNYGLNRVRFVSPVKVGSKIRARFVLVKADDIPNGVQLIQEAVIEIEGENKPACIAEIVTRWYF